MKSRILMLLGSLALIVSLSFLAYAHLKAENEIDDLIYEVGNFKVKLEGSIVDTYLIPGVNLVETPFILTNEGNIPIDLRVKITYKLNGIPFNDFAVAPSDLEDDPNLIANDFNINNNFTVDPNLIDYYLLDSSLAAGQTVNLLSILILDGYKVQSAQSGQNFEVIVTIHAKQVEHVTWTDLGTKFTN